MIGRHIDGCGCTLEYAKTNWGRIDLFDRVFNCQMIGTFNIKTKEAFDFNHYTPSFVDGKYSFYHCKIETDTDYEYGWIFKWVGSKMPKNIIEVYFKKKIPESFKGKELTITISEMWDKDRINEWAKDKYWFQTFDWAEDSYKRCDSKMIWDLMSKDDYRNKTVLDFGCHYGYYAMKASKAGATVTGIDKLDTCRDHFKTINDHIELSDVKFIQNDIYPEEHFDYIFELSVYHWIDEPYDKLQFHVEILKSKCDVLYLELINPALSGKLTEKQIDKIVGGEVLIKYKHKIRGTRTLYRIS